MHGLAQIECDFLRYDSIENTFNNINYSKSVLKSGDYVFAMGSDDFGDNRVAVGKIGFVDVNGGFRATFVIISSFDDFPVGSIVLDKDGNFIGILTESRLPKRREVGDIDRRSSELLHVKRISEPVLKRLIK